MRKTSKRRGGATASSSRAARRKRIDESSQDIVFEPSSGNVFLDLGFPRGEAEYLLLRSKLMLMLTKEIEGRQLTQAQAARLLGVSQPRVSDVMRGRIQRFTIDALVELLARAGVRLEVTASRPAALPD